MKETLEEDNPEWENQVRVCLNMKIKDMKRAVGIVRISNAHELEGIRVDSCGPFAK